MYGASEYMFYNGFCWSLGIAKSSSKDLKTIQMNSEPFHIEIYYV